MSLQRSPYGVDDIAHHMPILYNTIMSLKVVG